VTIRYENELKIMLKLNSSGFSGVNSGTPAVFKASSNLSVHPWVGSMANHRPF
jgi:hypothetical protein